MRLRLRDLAKGVFLFLATLVILPVLLVHWLKSPILGKDRALEGSTELLSLVPGLIGQYLRCAFLRWTLAKCHPSASIGFGTTFSKCDTRIDENVYIGGHCNIGLAHIERDVLIAAGSYITSGTKMHGIDDPTIPIKEQEGVFSLVTIGAGSWIGSCAVVMADVGHDSVVAAGAVVAKPIPAKVIAGGVPATVIRER